MVIAHDGKDYTYWRDKLIQALEHEGSGELVHRIYGKFCARDRGIQPPVCGADYCSAQTEGNIGVPGLPIPQLNSMKPRRKSCLPAPIRPPKHRLHLSRLLQKQQMRLPDQQPYYRMRLTRHFLNRMLSGPHFVRHMLNRANALNDIYGTKLAELKHETEGMATRLELLMQTPAKFADTIDSLYTAALQMIKDVEQDLASDLYRTVYYALSPIAAHQNVTEFGKFIAVTSLSRMAEMLPEMVFSDRDECEKVFQHIDNLADRIMYASDGDIFTALQKMRAELYDYPPSA
ncbi:hypothetical protein CHS0354_018422 [Potamilus streckersoni]|uniref:Uncharacterized protein n=1 Tax=Potamilus streckersoni TaxID=2493646 RepID=A0AAE0TB85_9BIVA|nr:hypothetical protein CHS0354_018422 [Potamilus streckersoni]